MCGKLFNVNVTMEASASKGAFTMNVTWVTWVTTFHAKSIYSHDQTSYNVADVIVVTCPCLGSHVAAPLSLQTGTLGVAQDAQPGGGARSPKMKNQNFSGDVACDFASAANQLFVGA